MTTRHDQLVSAIAQQVRGFFEAKRPFRIFHGSTNSTRVLSFKQDEMLDVSELNGVLSVDADQRTAIVEPNVPMDKLVRQTLKHGLIPPVVMEFPGITVGGAIQGNGGESSSFKWGCFNQVFNWYEIIQADGSVIKASPETASDLFYGIAGSAGTLGILTSAEINLIPTKQYVELTYTPTANFQEAKDIIDSPALQASDFIDGILFAKDRGVIISGQLTDNPGSKTVKFSRAHDQWYYLHVEETLKRSPNGWSESVPLVDYLFRYDRGAFWVGRFAFEMFGVPYTRLMRWLLNPILHTRKLYQALQESGASQQHVVQDLVLPGDRAVEFLEYIDSHLAVYPLWLCPMLPDGKASFQLNNIDTPAIINVGVWGSNIPDYDEFVAANRLIETQVLALGGKKWSYAHSYFTHEEFWSMYDKPLYDSLRKKYHAEHLPDIYDKVTVKTRHPIDRRKAVIKTILGMAKLKIEK